MQKTENVEKTPMMSMQSFKAAKTEKIYQIPKALSIACSAWIAEFESSSG